MHGATAGRTLGNMEDVARILGIEGKAMTHPPVPSPDALFKLDICDAVDDHTLCPGYSILYAGDLLLGPVECTCHCHRKKKTITH